MRITPIRKGTEERRGRAQKVLRAQQEVSQEKERRYCLALVCRRWGVPLAHLALLLRGRKATTGHFTVGRGETRGSVSAGEGQRRKRRPMPCFTPVQVISGVIAEPSRPNVDKSVSIKPFFKQNTLKEPLESFYLHN